MSTSRPPVPNYRPVTSPLLTIQHLLHHQREAIYQYIQDQHTTYGSLWHISYGERTYCTPSLLHALILLDDTYLTSIDVRDQLPPYVTQPEELEAIASLKLYINLRRRFPNSHIPHPQ